MIVRLVKSVTASTIAFLGCGALTLALSLYLSNGSANDSHFVGSEQVAAGQVAFGAAGNHITNHITLFIINAIQTHAALRQGESAVSARQLPQGPEFLESHLPDKASLFGDIPSCSELSFDCSVLFPLPESGTAAALVFTMPGTISLEFDSTDRADARAIFTARTGTVRAGMYNHFLVTANTGNGFCAASVFHGYLLCGQPLY